MRDDPTLRFYAEHAAEYAAVERATTSIELETFMSRLPQHGRVLELGTGSGRHAKTMIERGFDVDPTDGSAELAIEAAKLLGRPVKIMLFEELNAEAAYDGVWASASLLHVPVEALTLVLRRVHRAMVRGGHFFASYKAGDGAGRDTLGRYYNYPTSSALERHYLEAANWEHLTITQSSGSGYDKQPTQWLLAQTRK